jgi:hypothetical protein
MTLRDAPQWIENLKQVASFIENGCEPEDAPRRFPEGWRGYCAKVDEIGPMHEQFGISTLVLAGVEPAISASDQDYESLSDAHRQLWLDLLYRVSREPSMVASSRHLLYIGRKARD